MSNTDSIIILCYFLAICIISLIVSKRSRNSVEGYFLGGRKIPWYILGVSGMATFVDLAGTAFQVAFFYMIGVKGFWVGFQGNVALLLAFFMIFMGKWLNRSGAMTNAELIMIRFGTGKAGQLARFITSAAVIITVLAFLGYFFVGATKVLPQYIPFFENPRITALFFFAIVGVITVFSGYRGVVATDLFQSILMFGLIIYVAIKAITIATPEYFAEFASEDWLNFWPKDGNWHVDFPAGYETMENLGILLIFWILANILQGFGLPFDAWSSQPYYAARNERESSLLAGQWIVLFSFRFALMAGLGILAIGIKDKIGDPELALTTVISELIPSGTKGLLLAALIAAALSTTNAFVNSSAAYFVNDIYKPFIKPSSSKKWLVKMSLITSASLLVIGVIIGWNLESLNTIWGWIVMGLLTGTLPPNIIKWFWWRFNGIGYATGVFSGIIASGVAQIYFIDEPVYIVFAIVFGIASLGTIIGNFFGKMPDMEVLVTFYKRVKPFGFWKPVQALLEPEQVLEINKENKRDFMLILPAVVWQVSLFYSITALVFQKWSNLTVSFGICIIMSFLLYKYWYLNLKKPNDIKD